MQLDQALGQRKTEARPLALPRLGIQNLSKGLDYAPQVLGWYADAGIRDADEQCCLVRARR